MNEERTGKCLRQVEHIRGHLLHRYSITINQVQVLNSYEICCDTFCQEKCFQRDVQTKYHDPYLINRERN